MADPKAKPAPKPVPASSPSPAEAPARKAPEHEPGSPGDPNPNKKVPATAKPADPAPRLPPADINGG